MKVTPCPHGLEDVLGKSTGHRTPGLHVSEIYGNLYEHLEPERFTGGTPPPTILEAGLALELMVEEGLKARLGHRPGELVSPEGIIMSPDLVIVDTRVETGFRVGEIKLTWMSMKEFPRAPANSFPQKASKWLVQMKSYAKILETPYARLIAFFVNSDYRHRKAGARDGPEPALLAWDIEFSKREIDDNWSMILQHGKHMGVLP